MERVQLQSGREVEIRPIRATDGPALGAAYDRLSPRSKYNRFLAPKPHLSSSEVRYLVDVDGFHHLALIATPSDDPGAIVAVARLVRLPEERHTAEFAVVVADAYQRQGLASALLVRLARAARESGISRIRATILAENRAAQRLMEHVPAREISKRHNGPVKELELELAS
jgi:RimJ/RimL family protein N-acetyltransferase